MMHAQVRLAEAEVAAIKAAACSVFGEEAVVRLFGSRVRPNARGGDIDLHVEAARPALPGDEARFEQLLFARIDPQKIDLVISVRGAAVPPIAQIAYRDGVVL